MKNEHFQNSHIAAIATFSAALCALCMCLFINAPSYYADAENAASAGAFYTNAEVSDSFSQNDTNAFDDSVWGRLANAIKSGFEAWQG